jgi:hypothetical protein
MPKKTRPIAGRLTVAPPAPRRARAPATAAVHGPTMGRLAGVGADGQPWVDLPACGREGLPARTTVPLAAWMVGRELLVSFLDGDPDRPVVTGVIRAPGDPAADPAAGLEAVVDAERIVLTARREVVLRCGAASIALAADGRVVIKGVNLLSTASGLHRIRGGAVQIN